MCFKDDVITEEMMDKAHEMMGISFPGALIDLEVYTKNKTFGDELNEQVIMKYSSKNAEYDNLAAEEMRKWFDENHIEHHRDPESERTVIISTWDFLVLFGPKKKVKVSSQGHMNVQIYYNTEDIEVEVPEIILEEDDFSELEEYVKNTKEYQELFEDEIQGIHKILSDAEIEYDEEGGEDEVILENIGEED